MFGEVMKLPKPKTATFAWERAAIEFQIAKYFMRTVRNATQFVVISQKLFFSALGYSLVEFTSITSICEFEFFESLGDRLKTDSGIE